MPTLTETQLAAKFATTTRNWDQWCQAAVRQACAWTGGAPAPNYLSAIQAYHASKIVSKDASKAPIGAVHYWDIGSFGHVAGGLGGERVFMASSHIDHAWADNIGTTTVSAYSRTTGARYLGWARSNGHNVLSLKVAPKTPTKGQKFTTARAGEGMIAISERTGVSLAKLESLNPTINPSGLRLGQRVRIA